MNHTPTPWTHQTPKFGESITIITDMCTPLGHIYVKDTSKRAYEEANANAAFIVQAVNSYQAMREALQKLLTTTELNLDELEQETQEALAQAKAALALADGKEAQP